MLFRSLKVILFGDSISAGGNASKFQGCWPWQPPYGELVAWKLQQYYGSKVTFLNPSQAGAVSMYAVEQAESLVAAFQPDLVIIAFGMNDRAPARQEVHRSNLEKGIDLIRKSSPNTEFILVSPMMNNPKQPTGSDPIFFIRDEDRKISQPGLAHVDITTTMQQMLTRIHYLDLSGNGVNHPNDFLHRIYAQRILEVLLPQ